LVIDHLGYLGINVQILIVLKMGLLLLPMILVMESLEKRFTVCLIFLKIMILIHLEGGHQRNFETIQRKVRCLEVLGLIERSDASKRELLNL